MRIVYSNIVDNATTTLTESSQDASYPVENVQDQRLSVLWKSTGATDENVIVTLPTFPEYPDNATATSVMYNFATSAESFVATKGTIDVTTYPGILRLTATSAGSSIARATGVALASSSTIIIKMRSPDALSTTVSVLIGTSTSSTIAGITTTMSMYSSTLVGGASATTLTILGTNTASTGTVFDIGAIYIGTVVYNTQLTDNSGNSHPATVSKAIKMESSNKGLFRFPYTGSICTFSSSFLFNKQVCAVSLWYRRVSGLTSYRTLVGTPNNVHPLIVASGETDLSLFDGSFKIFSVGTGPTDYTTFHHIVVNYTNTAASLYYDGNFISTIAHSLNLATNTINCFGNTAYLTSAYPCGDLYDVKLYNRLLLNEEILHLFNNENFVTEYDDLWGDWTIDKDLGVNTIAILGHNIKTGTLVKVQANNSNEWGDPPLNTTLTVNPETILNFYSSTYYYKYWKFYFGQGLVEIGRLWLSNYLNVSPSSLLDFKVTKKRSDTVIHGKNRQKWAAAGVGWRRFELSFPRSEEAMIYLLTKMYDTIGNHSSVIFCNFDSLRDWVLTEPCYSSIDGDLALVHTQRMGFTYTLALEEEK